MAYYRGINNRTFKEKGKNYLKSTKYPSIPLSSNDIQIVTDSGDRLDNLAYQFYYDTSYWIWIVLANPDKLRRDSYYVAPSTFLRIPANINGVVENFKAINR
jgi:hypothetical protein